MPSTKSKRDVILKTSIASGTAADLNVSYEALFDSANAGEITYEDESGARDEKTKYKLVFEGASGPIGTMTIKFVADGVLPTGSSAIVTKPVARYDLDPAGRETAVAQLTAYAASYERIWKQNLRDASRDEVVDNVVKLDVRVDAASGYTVTQTVKSTDPGELVLLYEWATPAAVAVSGSVTLTPSLVPAAGYTAGNIRITDNDPTSGSARRR